MSRHGTDQWLVTEVRGKDGGGYAHEAYIDTFREGLRRVAPWRIYLLSRAISWALSFMAPNATHHKFSAVPRVQQPLLLQGLCRWKHAYICSDVRVSHHPYGQPLEYLHRPDFISSLSQYLKSRELRKESSLSQPWLSWM